MTDRLTPTPSEAKPEIQKATIKTKIAENPAVKKVANWIKTARQSGKPPQEILQYLSKSDSPPPSEQPQEETIENEQNPETTAPKISEFPEKVKPKIQEAYDKSKEITQKIEEDISVFHQVTEINNQNKIKTSEVEQQLQNPSEDDKNKANELLAKVNQEFAILQKIAKKLSQGKDASELRNNQSPMESPIYTAGITEEEVRLFGENKNISDRVSQLRFRINRDYARRKKQFDSKLKEAFRYRVFQFINKTSLNSEQLNILNNSFSSDLGQAETESIPDDFKTRSQEFFTQAWSITKTASQRAHYLKIVDEWTQHNEEGFKTIDEYLKQGSAQKSLIERLSLSQSQLQTQTKNFLDYLKIKSGGYADEISRILAQKIKQEASEFFDVSLPIKNSTESSFISSDKSQEAVELAKQLKSKLVQLKTAIQASDISEYVVSDISDEESSVEFYLTHAKEKTKEDEQFPNSKNLLWHTGNYEIIKKILKSGVLASRQYQIDHFGESVFNTGGRMHKILVGKNHITLKNYYSDGSDRTLTREEFDANERQLARKNLDQETHQTCFSEDHPYHYFDGVAFVFSKASLFAKSQFIHFDGWHLYDKAYDDEIKDSPGFAADLQSEPMSIVVSEERKEDFDSFVKTELNFTPDVIYIPNFSSASPEEKDRILQQVRNHFFLKHTIDIPQGRIMPTGNKSDSAGHSSKEVPLYAYIPRQ